MRSFTQTLEINHSACLLNQAASLKRQEQSKTTKLSFHTKMLHSLISLLVFTLSLLHVTIASSATTDIRGKVDLRGYTKKIDRNTFGRISLTLNQIYQNNSIPESNYFYDAQTTVKTKNGDFEFENVVLDTKNEYSYYVLKAQSLDFNFQPNRVLVKVQSNDTSAVQYFANYMGREYFPSPEILYPEQLQELKTLSFRPLAEVPLRNYVQPRKLGFLKSGPLAGIFQSKWKTGALVAVIASIALPYIMEKLDPETAKAIKEEKAKMKRNKLNGGTSKK